MSDLVSVRPEALRVGARHPSTPRRARPAPRRRTARAEGSSPYAAPGSDASAPQQGDEEMLVAIRSRIEGANLARVCLIIGGLPYAPSGTAVIRPGETSSMIELSPSLGGIKGAVYFELCAGNHNIPLVTDELFDIAPGAVLVITIGDYTRAHNASMELEGAVARLELTRPLERAETTA